MNMRFEWDEHKNEENLRKHKINFADVPAIFAAPMLVRLDDRKEYGEERWVGIGYLSVTVAVVVWVERRDDVTRIISARKANRKERERYERFLSH
ncbi:MAG TPA: BrnT family toxin [Pirellulales bacterium]